MSFRINSKFRFPTESLLTAFLSLYHCDTEIYDLFFEIFNKIDNSAALSSKNNGLAARGRIRGEVTSLLHCCLSL